MQETSYINPPLTDFGRQFMQLEPDSVTVEEGDLLYALVRMTKPTLAVETGTGHAIATKRIGEALRTNKKGFLLSCDTDPEYVRDAKMATKGLPVDIRCTTGLVTLQSFDGQQAGFIFVDAGGLDNRLAEIAIIFKLNVLAPKGLLVIHDALNGKYEELVHFAKREGWPFKAIMEFDSLAGIAVLQKP